MADRYLPLPPEMGVRPGLSMMVIVHATDNVELEAFAIVPFADEVPPPPPQPWTPQPGDSASGEDG